ncbi:MAG: hypothetical protein ACYTFA_16995, partial [Planctomycetota bacterium]
PDYARYAIGIEGVVSADGDPLAGDSDRIMTALVGDVTGDLRVNSTDVGAIGSLASVIPPVAFESDDPRHVRSDVDNDGTLSPSDVSAVLPLRGRDATGIDDPSPVNRARSPLPAGPSLVEPLELPGTPADDLITAWPLEDVLAARKAPALPALHGVTMSTDSAADSARMKPVSRPPKKSGANGRSPVPVHGFGELTRVADKARWSVGDHSSIPKLTPAIRPEVPALGVALELFDALREDIKVAQALSLHAQVKNSHARSNHSDTRRFLPLTTDQWIRRREVVDVLAMVPAWDGERKLQP